MLRARRQGNAQLAHRLELHYLANPEASAQFALLTDWADAAEADAARRRTRCSTTRCSASTRSTRATRRPRGDAAALPPAAPRRAASARPSSAGSAGSASAASSSSWSRLLADRRRQRPSCDLGARSRIAERTPYVVTLDSDTGLPPGAAARAGRRRRASAQPAAASTRRPAAWSAGYGILQPRVATPLPGADERSRSSTGCSPASAASTRTARRSSEVYQDLFGEGTFTGKGLLNVQAMHAVLGGRLPEGQVLSHDLLEGSLARCAAVTDITVIEDAPFHADVAASRVHRWTRGDWQLLPLPAAPAAAIGIARINRWKMFDNLRRSLVAPVSLALLLLALWHRRRLALGGAGAGRSRRFGAGPLMGALAGAGAEPRRHRAAPLLSPGGSPTCRARWPARAWQLAQLLQHALMLVDAIVRALWRMAVSRRHLLRMDHRRGGAGRGARPTSRAFAAQALRPSRRRPSRWRVAVRAATPAPAGWRRCCACSGRCRRSGPGGSAGRGRRAATTPLPRDRPRLPRRRRARHLAPVRALRRRRGQPPAARQPADRAAADMVAHRTSPTNIGLYLLARLLRARVRLDRHAGLLTAEARSPRCDAAAPPRPLPQLVRHAAGSAAAEYVSTVDSGNLCGHLLASRRPASSWRSAVDDRRARAAAPARIAARRSVRAAATPAGALPPCSTSADGRRRCRSASPARPALDEACRRAPTRWRGDAAPATLPRCDRVGGRAPPADRDMRLLALARLRALAGADFASSTTASATCSTSAFASPSSSSTPASTTCSRPRRA